MVEDILEDYPRELCLPGGLECSIRPLVADDEQAFYDFFSAVPAEERLFIKHPIHDPAIIRAWCQNIDYERILPLLAWSDGRIVADASLHQQQGGWKRHIGRVSVLVHPEYRGRGLARMLVAELLDIARNLGLERMEAEFIGGQERALKVFGMLGFEQLVRLPDYVKDMQAVTHDYVLMGLELLTDEEYAGMG